MVSNKHILLYEETEIVRMLAIGSGADLSVPKVRYKAIEILEGGGVIYLPRSGFELSERERELISNTSNILTRARCQGRPTIIFDPAHGRIKTYHYVHVKEKMMRAQVKDTARPDLEVIMSRYSK